MPGILALLTLCGIFFLNSGSSAYASAVHGTSVNAQVTTTNHKVVGKVLRIHLSSSPEIVAKPHLYEGCGNGVVCIYPNASWNNGNPSNFYYQYGVNPIYNQYGVHRVFNNQYGSARVWFCTDANGQNCTWSLGPYTYTDIDLTPINSLLLTSN
jgi:hypothetical protein